MLIIVLKSIGNAYVYVTLLVSVLQTVVERTNSNVPVIPIENPVNKYLIALSLSFFYCIHLPFYKKMEI